MLSNQESAHQLKSFSILPALESAKGKDSSLVYNSRFWGHHYILRTRLLPWLHLLHMKKPTEPASHIDSRLASVSLYLTRAQGAPCQVITITTSSLMLLFVVYCFGDTTSHWHSIQCRAQY